MVKKPFETNLSNLALDGQITDWPPAVPILARPQLKKSDVVLVRNIREPTNEEKFETVKFAVADFKKQKPKAFNVNETQMSLNISKNELQFLAQSSSCDYTARKEAPACIIFVSEMIFQLEGLIQIDSKLYPAVVCLVVYHHIIEFSDNENFPGEIFLNMKFTDFKGTVHAFAINTAAIKKCIAVAKSKDKYFSLRVFCRFNQENLNVIARSLKQISLHSRTLWEKYPIGLSVEDLHVLHVYYTGNKAIYITNYLVYIILEDDKKKKLLAQTIVATAEKPNKIKENTKLRI